ncbi:MAG TPA: ProQ/FINO family protein [Thiolinea sp.]|nr:ProQ/FINO family protein [Thiolinea sp.]
MTDTPRKTLTLKRKPASDAADESVSTQNNSDASAEPLTRETRLLGKRIIIRREETKSNKPTHNSKGKSPTSKNKNSANKQKDAKSNQATEPAPSELQAKAMDRFLAERFEVWQTYKPLALGVEADLYQLMDQNQPPASKRVVQRLLRMHCNHGKYLQAVVDGQQRYTLAGELIGEVSETEREHANRTLKEQEIKKAQH